jgi:Zn-finger nucleic acid-binding protein
MEAAHLEPALETERCATCEGHWITSARYFAFLAEVPAELPSPAIDPAAADSPAMKRCPSCMKFMHYYRVGHGLAFGIDKCNTCGGVWLNKGEWETLKQAGISRQLHAISSDVWQADVHEQTRAAAELAAMERRLGAADFAELRRVGQWLKDHPHRLEMLAYLQRHIS